MTEAPLTLKCAVGGEEWPATSYKSTVDTDTEKVTPKNVRFWCPAEHFFNLRRAVNSGMFTKKEAANILVNVQRRVDDYHKLLRGGVG